MSSLEAAQREKKTAPEDPFYLVTPAGDNLSHFTPAFLLFWGILLLSGFFLINYFFGDFANMRKYGWDEDNLNYILRLSSEEKFFMVALLALIPSAVFIGMALERWIGKPILARVEALISADKPALRTAGVLTLAAAVTIACVASLALKFAWTTDDENVYVFQSRIFASGHLSLPSLPEEDRIFGDNIFLVNEGKIYGQYPFGHSFFILPGVILGLPRLMILLSAMLTVLGIYHLGKEIFDRKTGLLASMLLAASPMFLLMSSTVLSHPVVLMFLTWFGFFAVRTMRNGSLRDALLAGLFFGCAFHVRSATTFLLAGPAAALLAFSMLVRFRRDADSPDSKPKAHFVLRQTWKQVLALAAVIGSFLGVYLLLNYLANGSPFLTNYHAVWKDNSPFDSPFGFDKGAWNIYHTPKAGLTNMAYNFLRLNIWVLGWPIGFAPLAVRMIRRGKKLGDWILIAPIVLSFAAYFFFFWPGVNDTGPVLYYELILPIAILSARGIFAGAEWLGEHLPREKARTHIASFLAITILIASATTTQTMIRSLHRLVEPINAPYELLADRGIGEGVVFTDYYVKGDYQDSWVAGRRNTSPLLGDKLLFELNLGRERDEAFMKKYFPGKPAYVMWWTDKGPKLVSLEDYEEKIVTKNYPEVR